MKRTLLLAAFLSPSAALAHPGDHGGLSLQTMLDHLAREPDHAALAVATVALAVLLYRARTRK